MMDDLLLAFGLAMILEGLMPALSPRGWRQAVDQLGRLPDRSIRGFGLVLIVVGGLVFHLAR
jgi:uncharacterized protein YjeT (DUF2065 family)